jgi:micrococcal nuclease
VVAVSARELLSSASKQRAGKVVRTITFLAITLGVVASCSTRIESDAGGRVFAVVSQVVDGDTVHVSIGGTTEEIRLIGVDTPETVHPTKPVQCFGPEASQHTKSLLPRGTRVFLVRDIESRDKFGRLLAYMYRVSDNLFLNYELVYNGWARPYPYPPNITLETTFAEAAFHAQSQQLGLWRHC